jgi:hypothetical protein
MVIANPRRKLTVIETKRLSKLETIADKLKRGENVQNRQLQTWLSEDEYAQLEVEIDLVIDDDDDLDLIDRGNR